MACNMAPGAVHHWGRARDGAAHGCRRCCTAAHRGCSTSPAPLQRRRARRAARARCDGRPVTATCRRQTLCLVAQALPAPLLRFRIAPALSPRRRRRPICAAATGRAHCAVRGGSGALWRRRAARELRRARLRDAPRALLTRGSAAAAGSDMKPGGQCLCWAQSAHRPNLQTEPSLQTHKNDQTASLSLQTGPLRRWPNIYIDLPPSRRAMGTRSEHPRYKWQEGLSI